MVSFQCDYAQGAHPEILKKLAETNMEPLTGYGTDHYTESAKDKIRKACGCPDAYVEFISGGTQTNLTVISTMLRDWEGVIAAETGHINVHESGAIEFMGFKILEMPQHDGKIDAGELRTYLKNFYANLTRDHMVFPGLVYVTHPTEFGTLYTKAELTEIADICHEYEIPLYLDGARLGYGLMSRSSDMTLQDIARITDAFYIGGTKVGALCGEAAVFTGLRKPEHMVTSLKKRGALLAKGRLMGIQFDVLFTDDLYFKIARNAIDKAERLKEIIHEKGWEIYQESPTNQQFVLLKDDEMAALGEKVLFEIWDRYDDERTIVRLATSWATTDEDLDVLAGV